MGIIIRVKVLVPLKYIEYGLLYYHKIAIYPIFYLLKGGYKGYYRHLGGPGMP